MKKVKLLDKQSKFMSGYELETIQDIQKLVDLPKEWAPIQFYLPGSDVAYRLFITSLFGKQDSYSLFFNPDSTGSYDKFEAGNRDDMVDIITGLFL